MTLVRRHTFPAGIADGHWPGPLDTLQIQQMVMTKAMILANMKRFDDALKAIDEALEAAPDGKDNEGIKGFRKRIEEAKAKAEGTAGEG